jgi:hypothetical protein
MKTGQGPKGCKAIERKKLFLGLINYAPRHEDVWGNGGRAPTLRYPMYKKRLGRS